jgi:hypothetical protein
MTPSFSGSRVLHPELMLDEERLIRRKVGCKFSIGVLNVNCLTNEVSAIRATPHLLVHERWAIAAAYDIGIG